jgi:hypothetical protein
VQKDRVNGYRRVNTYKVLVKGNSKGDGINFKKEVKYEYQ